MRLRVGLSLGSGYVTVQKTQNRRDNESKNVDARWSVRCIITKTKALEGKQKGARWWHSFINTGGDELSIINA